MLIRQSILPLGMVFLSLLIFSCSGTKEVEDEEPEGFALGNTYFLQGYAEFQKGNFQTAAESFQTLIQIDSTLWHYESYPFLAECYTRLGKTKQALAIYDQGVEHAANLLAKNRGHFSDIRRYEELSTWRSNYPVFPSVLKVENGFTPYDSLPTVIKAVKPSYSWLILKSDVTGTTKLLANIDEQGRVVSVLVLQEVAARLTKPAVEALYQWRFTPLKQKGRIVKAHVVIPFTVE